MEDNRFAIIEQARRALVQEGAQESHSEELLALLDILFRAIQSASPSEDNGETFSALASNLVSAQSLLSLLKQQADELDALRKLSLNLTSSLDMSVVLNAVVREAMSIVQDGYNTHIYLYRNETLEFGAALQKDGAATQFSPPRRDGLTYTVARAGRIMIVKDMRNHPLYENVPPTWDLGSIIGIPLKINGHVLGVMNMSRSQVGGFADSEVRLLTLLADQAAVAISNASLHQVVSRKAYSDTVTGLPNRRALDERLERELNQARHSGQTFALVMMDLDGFKAVNDTYGHAVGDQVLRLFFNFMAQGLRTADFLARYGGDELTLIMTQTTLPAAILVAEKITEKLQKFSFAAPNGNVIRLGVSGGIAIYPMHGRSGADLLRAADEALYRAKRHKRGKFVVARGLTQPLDSHQALPSEG